MTAETPVHASPPLASAPPAGLLRPRPLIALEDVSVRFGRGEACVTALAETRLALARGDFVALVGPSGCGKSTILRLVSGLLPPSSGTVIVAGREVGTEPLRIGMAYQNATLLPWLTVRQNVMLPLKIVAPFRSAWRRNKRGEYRDRAEALLARVWLKGFGDKYPWQLSGGMRQNPDRDFLWFVFADHGIAAYSNGVMVSQRLLRDNPEAVRALVAVVNGAMLEVGRAPADGARLMARIEPNFSEDIERQRIEYAWRSVIATPEAVRLGAGDLDDTRLVKAIAQTVEVFELPRTLAPAEVFNRTFPPPASERVLAPLRA